jgi:dihydroorotase
MTTIYKNIQVFDSKTGEFKSTNLLIENGLCFFKKKITDLKHANIIEATHLSALPSLTDAQVHFREPGQTHKETLGTGSLSAAKGGITRVMCMPNTIPVLDNKEIILEAYTRAKEKSLIETFYTGSITKNLDGLELSPLEELASAGVRAFTDDGKGVMSDELMKKAFEYSAKLNIPIVDHAEDMDTHEHGVMNAGPVAEKYKLSGIPNQSEINHVQRGCDYSLQTGGHYHVLHVSAKESLELIKKYKKLGAKVTCEVSPHHLLLCDSDIPEKNVGELDSNFKMNPPIRSSADRDALQKGLIDGSIDLIATDHAPHTLEEKERKFELAPFGVVGVETAFPLVYTEFVRKGKLSFKRLNEVFNINPSKMLGLIPTEINEAGIANLFIVDLTADYIIDKNKFLSKNSNTPFHGRQVFGKVLYTYCQGKLVYQA